MNCIAIEKDQNAIAKWIYERLENLQKTLNEIKHVTLCTKTKEELKRLEDRETKEWTKNIGKHVKK